MAREPIDKIQEELEEQNLEFYGDEHPAGGSMGGAEVSSEMDADEVLESVTGDEITDEDGSPRPLDIARRIEKDEEDLDDAGYEPESLLEKIEKKEGDDDDSSDDSFITGDPDDDDDEDDLQDLE